MAHVESLSIYPMAGTQGSELEVATLTAGGFVGDHDYLLYTANENGGFERYSQKQCRDLAKLVVGPAEGALQIAQVDGSEQLWEAQIKLRGTNFVDINEFGDDTPCIDMGEDAAEAFSDFVGKSVRLAKKTYAWQTGFGKNPADRAVSTLHLVVGETIDELADKLPREEDGSLAFGPDRFRPQLVVRGLKPYAEAGWLKRVLLIGDAEVEIERFTKRCIVPGTDQRTGKRMNDVPRTYPHTLRSLDDDKPTVGVYAHLISNAPVQIRVGDEVRLAA